MYNTETSWKRGRLFNLVCGGVGVLALLAEAFFDLSAFRTTAAAGAGAGMVATAVVFHFLLFRPVTDPLRPEQRSRIEQSKAFYYKISFSCLAVMALAACLAAFLPADHILRIPAIAAGALALFVWGIFSFPYMRQAAHARTDPSLFDEREAALFDRAHRKGFDWMFLTLIFCGAAHVTLGFAPPLWFAFYFPPVIGGMGVNWFMMRNA